MVSLHNYRVYLVLELKPRSSFYACSQRYLEFSSLFEQIKPGLGPLGLGLGLDLLETCYGLTKNSLTNIC